MLCFYFTVRMQSCTDLKLTFGGLRKRRAEEQRMCFVTVPRHGHLAAAIRLSAMLALCGQEEQMLLPNYAPLKYPHIIEFTSVQGDDVLLCQITSEKHCIIT